MPIANNNSNITLNFLLLLFCFKDLKGQYIHLALVHTVTIEVDDCHVTVNIMIFTECNCKVHIFISN